MTGISHHLQFEEEEAHFQKIIDLNCMSALRHFKKIVRTYVAFHLISCFVFLCELALFFSFLGLEHRKGPLAIVIASVVLTLFTYLVLFFYFQAKKPEQFQQLKNWYILMCKKSIPDDVVPSLYHLSLANAAYRFAHYLKEKDFHCYIIHSPFPLLNNLFKQVSHLLHHRDLSNMKELLLLIAIEEHVALMKHTPTDLEVHASLANAYAALADVYRAPNMPLEEMEKELQLKYHAALDQAIEEYKIIDTYAPDDPWVHAQLASCYHDLGMYEEEIHHYESILESGQSDGEIIYRLGLLYFKQGHTAKGLQTYERLKEVDQSRGEELLKHYSFPDFLAL